MTAPILNLDALVTRGEIADAIGALESVVATREDLGAFASVIEAELPRLVRRVGAETSTRPMKWRHVVLRNAAGEIAEIHSMPEVSA